MPRCRHAFQTANRGLAPAAEAKLQGPRTPRPPAGSPRCSFRSSPACAIVTARTIESPSPRPPASLPRSARRHRGGTKLEQPSQRPRASRPARPPFAIRARVGTPSCSPVKMLIHGSSPALWHIALSSRFPTSRSSSAWSPTTTAGSSRCSTADPQQPCLAREQRVLGQQRKVDSLAGRDTGLAPRQREQRVQQPLLLLRRGDDPLAHAAQRHHRGVRVGQRHLDQRALQRDRCPQLVRGVGDESPLRLKRGLEPAEQRVEGRRQLAELVAAAVDAKALVQVLGADLARAGVHCAQRSQRTAGKPPGQADRQQCYHAKRDRRPFEQR